MYFLFVLFDIHALRGRMAFNYLTINKVKKKKQ